jgi:hypothetical protein
MALVLYWLSFCLAFAGACLAAFGFVRRQMSVCAIGLAALAAGMALFGIWSALTVSGFLGAVLVLAAAALLILLIKPSHASAQPYRAPPPSKDPVS